MKEIPSQVLRNGATRWKQAYQRYFKKLSGRPVIKTRHGRSKITITLK
jgi:putative transposase